MQAANQRKQAIQDIANEILKPLYKFMQERKLPYETKINHATIENFLGNN
jgi:hypothetical protein